MNTKATGAGKPRTDFPPFRIGALHIPLQRIAMDRDAILLQGALLATSAGVRRRWQNTRKVAAVSRLVALVAYFGGVGWAFAWAAQKLWS